METSEFNELIPFLPEELGLECLTRLPYSAHLVATRVCRRWRELIQSREFYYERKKLGYTRQVCCLVQSISSGLKISADGRKPGESPSYGLTVFDPVTRVWGRLDSIPWFPNGLPLFCQLGGCEGKLVVMGGWDPVSYVPVTDVYIYDFSMQRWRKGKDMPKRMSFYAVGSSSDRVYVAGGHDENKNALKAAWVYDSRLDEWTELTQMSQERDECEGVVIGDEFWVVSGYKTENQGDFEGSADVYELGSGKQRRVEGVWEPGRCPRSNVGVDKDGRLLCWGEMESGFRVGSCGLNLRNRVLLTGSEYEGGPNGFCIMDVREGQKGKLEKINVPSEFSGFVQSGRCVEI